MSSDPAAFIAGVPVKISERFRPPRRVTLPAACHHQVNTELFSLEYDFAVEKTTLKWVQDRRNKIEKEEKERKERVAEYDRKKAERLAKEEEERERRKKEDEERLRLAKEERERQKLEEEEEKKRLEKEREEKEHEEGEQTVDTDNKETTEDVATTPDAGGSCGEGNSEAQGSGADGGGSGGGNNSNSSNTTDQQHTEPQQNVSSPATMPTTTPSTAMSNSYTQDSSSSSYEWMLKPTPIPSQKSSMRSPLKTPTNINFADFEGEGNDPFDSAALKSINDMEELAKVLNSTNIGQQTVDQNSVMQQGFPSNDKNTLNSFTNDQGIYNTYGQYPYFMQQQLHQQNIAQSRQAFPQYSNNPGTTVSQPVSTSSSSVPSYTSSSQYGGDIGRNFQNPYYSQQWNSGYNVNSPSKTAQFVPYDYRLQNTTMSNNINTSQAGVISPSNNTGNTPLQSYSNSNSSEAVRTPNKRQDLEDFYSRYYSQNKSGGQPNQSSGGGQSGDSTPSHSSSSGAAGSTNGSLRSCRSVPDLTAPEDSEVTKLSSGLPSEGRGFSHTPPPRPSSTGLTGLEDWKPLPDIPGLNEPSPHQHTPLHTVGKSRLPDPFTELTTDAQALVQSMAEMGFPRPRVARAVQKLGTDHKKLLEVLLVLQSLQENGEDGYKAERAFYHYMGDVQKTRDHIAAAKQLLDLGFEEERIVDALLKHDNNRDKALEELIA
ncbi:hypothetical protein Pmani_017235 [Petrolisthes manimaculis]|uniref:Ubiquitin-associated protein 1 n=1 Tax=Petrolisthes manimaculis TaxID=1843537 RepID=A0AAE1PNH5_9EUCA|nr:hypothetical protein Pmani_017235 [Petrolisthes manimaculis]